MRSIIFNSTNLVSDNQYNNVFRYVFPAGGAKFKNNSIALGELTMYNSFYNITSATTYSQYDNNFFQYIWVDGNTYDVLIPDGYYEIADINTYLQSVMTTNKHYLLNSSSEQVFYLEMEVNSNVYAVQFNCYAVPSTLPSGWSLPSGASWTLPTSDETPQFVISSSNNFYKVVGFSAGTYPSTAQSSTYSATSDLVPQVSPVNAILIRCSLANNTLSIPNDFLYAFTQGTTTLGQTITIRPPDFLYCPMYDCSANDITISFYDQDLNNLYLVDTNLVAILVVADTDKI